VGVTGPGSVGSGAPAGESPPHFGQQVARLGAGCHGVRFRGRGFAGNVRSCCTLESKLLSWALGVAVPGFVGSGAPAGERPLHFGQQVACLGNERHGARSRGVGCSGR